MDIKELCDLVRQTAFEVHAFHGHGHLERVYENALAHRLRKTGIRVDQQYPIRVYDADGVRRLHSRPARGGSSHR